MAFARYRYNIKEKRCFVLYESTKATKEEMVEELSQVLLPNGVKDLDQFKQKDDSLAFEYELEKVSGFSFKTTFKHENALLEVEELAPTIITATLRNVEQQFDTIYNWPIKVEDGVQEYIYPDYGSVVFNSKDDTYQVEYGKPQIFNTYWDEFDKEKDWLFFFDYAIHQVNKDKDMKKPWLYYADDFSPAISKFIYKTISPHLSILKGKEKEVKNAFTLKEQNALKGQIVQLPGQDGTMLKDWRKNGYSTSYWRYVSLDESWWEEVDEEQRQKLGFEFFDFIRRIPYEKREEAVKMAIKKGVFGKDAEQFMIMEEVMKYYTGEEAVKYTDPRILDYDFAFETKDTWIKSMGELPALVISFLPTMFYGRKVPRDAKLTGTKWVEKLWEVFIQHDVPVVLRCYPGFIFENVWRYHNEWTKRISAITELPKCIDNREIGGSTLLVYFNCPWIGKGISDRVKWDSDCDLFKKKDSINRLWNLGKITARQRLWYAKPQLDPRFKDAFSPFECLTEKQQKDWMIWEFGFSEMKNKLTKSEVDGFYKKEQELFGDTEKIIESKKEMTKTIKKELEQLTK
ncbi:hypothetical protein [endosymbiont GvMRE of Glomus versiforme]|uniref:hypothetical protein n=1 Tax=endosymbiont GvMRE of Glomus versiforme TaxID=2039283 RepID=UPI000EBC43FF|nr:hypothetical protein [endosymbiont GvMRE of Glomus versiforme]RHZ35663.1 hypothetical protein GvMRE_IIg314 [endosymbiont GvMRE of Glomus versiforme]